MLELLHDYLVLQLFLNAVWVSIGMVVGQFLAWATRVERRYRIRVEFVRILVLVAIVLSLLITTLVRDAAHFPVALGGGLAIGFGIAFWSRLQAKPPTRRAARAGAVQRRR